MAKESHKYDLLAKELIPFIGGKANVTWFSRCVTRLRFTVKDRSLVQKEEIDKLHGVIGSQWSGEQFQIIIGPEVDEAYETICRINGLSPEDAVDETIESDLEKPKRTFASTLNAVIDAISGCITPLLPMLIGSGMIKVVLVLLLQFNVLTTDDPTYIALNFIGDAGFYFLPVAVGASGAKKFGANMFIGVMLGGILLHPTFVQAVADGNPGSIFGIPITSFKYSSTIFPMILTMWVCGYVERFVARHSPKPVRSILEPLVTLIVMAPLMLCVLGPLGAILGNYLTAGIMWVYDKIGFLGVAIICCLHPILVMTGMHTTFIPFVAQMFATSGVDPIMGPGQLVSNMNEGIASLVVFLKSKNDDVKAEALSCSITALVGGITEPALYGINLKYKTPLVAVIIGNFFGGLWCGLTQVFRYAYGGSNLWGLAVFIGKPGNLVNELIAVAIGAAVTFAATMILYKPEPVSYMTSGVEPAAAPTMRAAKEA